MNKDMSKGLIKETVTLTQSLGKESSQLLIEGDIIVPDVKPDMDYILKADAETELDKTDVSADRINFSGDLNLKILYLAKGSEKPIHSISSSAAIDDFITMQGIDRGMWIELSSNILNIDYKMLNDRKISYRAVIDVEVTAEQKLEQEIITNIEELPEEQIKRRILAVNKTVENKKDRFSVKDELNLPPGKPNIRELLQTSISVANKELKVLNGRVAVSGELVLSTLYKGDDAESVIEFVEHELPFNGSIESAAAKEGMMADVILKPREQYIQAIADEDGEDRLIEAEISIDASLKLSSQSDIEILEDAYIVNKKLDFETEQVKYPKLVCKNKNQCPVKEVIELSPESPDIFQIFRVTGNVITDDIEIKDNQVIVEGAIDTDILYIAKNDSEPLYNYKTAVPFKQVIETKDAMPGMEVFMEASVDHIGFNMLSERETELRFSVSFNTKVIENMETDIVTDVTFSDIDKSVMDNMPSMVIYVVQKGDTIWKIAKKYNASLEDIMTINDIEDPDMIVPGQKLLILKKVMV